MSKEQEKHLKKLVCRAYKLPASEWKSADWGRLGVLCMEAICGDWGELLSWMDDFETRLVSYWDRFVAARPNPTPVEDLLQEGVSAWLECFDRLRVLSKTGGAVGSEELRIAEEGQRLLTLVRILLMEESQAMAA